MIRLFFIISLLSATATFSLAAVFTSTQTGNWGAGATWVGGTAPGTTDDVIIADGHTVSLTSNTTVNDVTINIGGTIDNGNKRIYIYGNYIINGTHAGNDNIRLYGIDVIIDGIGTISNSSQFQVRGGDITILSTANIEKASGTFRIFSGLTVTNYGTMTIGGNMVGQDATAKWINSSGSTLHAKSIVLASGILDASALNNTVNYCKGADQDIKLTADASYHNLQCTGSGIKTLPSGMTINGDLTISSTLDVSSNDYDLIVKGNWVNTGTFEEQSATVTFSGTGAQSISNAADKIFYDLIVNKSSGTLTLANDAIVSNTFSMTAGNIDASLGKITLGTSIVSVGTFSYTSGIIIGEFERWINSTGSDVLFPIGTNTNYRPGVINFSNLTNGSLVVRFVESIPGTDGLPLKDGTDSIRNTFTEGYWDFTAANSLASSNYDIKLLGTSFTSFTINAATRLLKRNDSESDWIVNGSHVSASGDTAIRNTLTSLSAQFAFGDSTQCQGPETGAISGSDSVCTSTSSVAYSVDNTIGSTYNWTIIGGLMASGQGTNSITVDWGGTGMEGNVRVVETDDCTDGAPIDFPVNIHTLSTSSISGFNEVPENIEGVLYCVTERAGYTYTWEITGGSLASGAGIDSITVDWGGQGAGNVRVTGSTDCGSADAIDLPITIYGTTTSLGTGNWNNSGTWDCNCVPGKANNVVIASGHTVSLNASTDVNNFSINSGGQLSAGRRILKVYGDFVVNGTYTGTTRIQLHGSGTIIDGTGTIINTDHMDIRDGSKTIQASASLTKTGGQLRIREAGITITNNGTFTISDNIKGNDVTSTWINNSNSTLNITGELLVTGVLTASASGNTVNYNGSDAQDIKDPTSSTYYNLTLSGSNTKDLTANTTVSNNLAISSTLDAIAGSDFDIALGGNWNNTGTFDEQNATITINGTGAQAITNTSGETFYDFTSNKSSGTLTINDNVIVSNTLTMTDGVIDTGSDTLTLGTALANEGTLSYSDGIVTGYFERWINTTSSNFVFPIGTSSNYRPATISFTNLTGGSLTATFIESTPGVNGLLIDDSGTDVYNTFSEGYWDLSESNSLASTNYDLQLTGTAFSSYSINSSTRLLKRTDPFSDWTVSGSHVSASGSTAKRSAMNGLSHFAFGDTEACDPPTTSAITGSDSVCISVSGVAYSVTNHTNSSYAWVITGGTQASGTTTNSITVDWGATGQVGSVQVTETDNCGSADAVILPVTIHTLPTSTIDGKIQVLEFETEPYSVTNNTGYSYTWIITGGSQASGGNTNSITVKWGAEGVGRVQVIASTGCGAADIESLDVNLIYTAVKSTGTGNWNNTSTWDCSCIPNNTQSVTIDSGHVVTLDVSDTVTFFTIHATAEFNSSSNTLVLTGDYKVNGTHSGSGNTVLNGTNAVIDGVGLISNTGELQLIGGNKTVFSEANLTKTTGAITIATGITVTNNGAITVGGSITGAAGTSVWTNSADATLNIGSVLLSTGVLNASASGNTINYYGSVAQDIKAPASSYHHLSLTGSNTKSLTSNTDINGDIVISSILDVTAANDYDINLAGNWSNSGTFNEQEGTVTIDGTLAQSVTNTSGEIFYDFITNKASETLTLNDNVTVSNILTMTSGNIDAASDKLILGTSAVAAGTLSRTSGTILGSFERWIASTGVGIAFPLGTAASYRPASITFTNLTNGSLIGKFVSTNPGTSGLPANDGSFSIDATFTEGYWSFDDANSIASTDYDLELTGTGFSSYSIVANTRLLKRADAVSDWLIDGTHVAASGSIAKREALSGFCHFAFGDTATCSGPATSAITGSDSVCASASGVAYSVTNNPPNTYTWTILGGSVASGQGTNSITVNWGATERDDANVRVNETDACTDGDAVDNTVAIHTLPTSSITGNTSLQAYDSGEPYSVSNNTNYTYAWSVLGGGGTIASGQGTNSITVNWLGENNDVLQVIASSGCSGNDTKTLEVAIVGTVTSVGTGDYSNTATWDCSCVPGSGANIIIDNGHTVTLTATTTVGNLTINTTGELQNSTFALNVDGNYILNGIHSGSGDVNVNGDESNIDGSGSITSSGVFRIGGGDKTVLSSADLSKNFSGSFILLSGINLTNNGVFTFSGDISGSATSSTWINGASSTLKAAGAILSTGSLTPTGSGNTVEYNLNGAQNVKVTTSGYQNLLLSTGGTKTLIGGIDVNNTLTIASGVTLDASGSNYNINLAGNWANSGTFNEQEGSLIFDGSSTIQTINTSGITTETFYAMQINSGTQVSLPAGKQLTLDGNYTNNGTFYIRADASSMASFINNGTISGSGKDSIEFYLSGSTWHYVTQPVSSSIVNPIGGNYVKQYNEDAGNWDNLTRGDPLEVMRAYTVKYFEGSRTNRFGGTANSGSINYPMSYTSGVGDGWHLVGNPYPSAIDWNAGAGWTKTNIDGTIYYYDGTQYATWNGTIGTNGGTRYIPAMQGVFVHCTSTGAIGVTNAVRVHNTQSFWKKKKRKNDSKGIMKNLLKLKSSSMSYRDEIVIHFQDNATVDFDSDYDAERWFSYKSYIPELYTKITTGLKMSINVLPELSEDFSIAVGLKIGTAGNYSIEAVEHNGFDSRSTIFLEDLYEGVMVNIRDSSYNFYTDAYYNDDRFVLHFSPVAEIIEEPIDMSVCSGNTSSFYVNAIGSGTTYQWQQNTGNGWSNLIDDTVCSGSQNDSLIINNSYVANHSVLYRCYVVNDIGSDTSNIVVNNVVASPEFNNVATEVSVCENNEAQFLVSASGVITDYNWQQYTGVGWIEVSDSAISGENSNSMLIHYVDSSYNNTKYRCYTSNNCGSDTTLPINLIINQPFFAEIDTVICQGDSIYAGGMFQYTKGVYYDSLNTLYSCDSVIEVNIDLLIPIEILFNPYDTVVREYGDVSFVVSANGTDIEYIWQVNDGGGWVNILDTVAYSGSSTETLSITSVSYDNNQNMYRCILNNNCCSDTSNVAVMYVEKAVEIKDGVDDDLVSIYSHNNEIFVICNSDNQIPVIDVFNIIGQELKTNVVSDDNHKHKIVINDYKGVCFVRIRISGESVVRKVHLY